jgi:molecular chaperone HtpG
MTAKVRDGIVFQVETSRILEILTSEIYDSPHALLRENVQNAYDAVLMRLADSSDDAVQGRIDVTLTNMSVEVRDNGIGMDERVLRENYWKAGSSGKRTDAARKAGVVGTFGIGAMANFGVAEEVIVQTRALNQATVLRSSAKRSELSIQEECIRLEEVDDPFDYGTLVQVQLDPEHRLNVANAVAYLRSYVHLLRIPVICNGTLISQGDWDIPAEAGGRSAQSLGLHSVRLPEGTVSIALTAFGQNGRIMAEMTQFDAPGYEGGNGLLIQQEAQLMGFRNWFGLAPIPITGLYTFGGFLNVPFLQPTAGREALSRETIQRVTHLISAVENVVSSVISTTELADRNVAFQNHARNGPIEWSRHVSVRLAPHEDRVPLVTLHGRAMMYYPGSDAATIRTFASRESPLVVLDQSNPRRKIQLRYITEVLRLSPIPDQPSVLRTYAGLELTYAEAAFLIRATSILIEEYLVSDVEIALAELSHGVQLLVQTPGDPALRIFLSRNHPSLGAVVQAYSTMSEAFGAFVRDFIRMHVYDKISPHVPSATRQGAEALLSQIRRTRELFRYDEDEFGSLEPLLSDLLSGEASVGEVIRRAGRRVRPQTQRVTSHQVGSVENELPDVVHAADPSTDPLEAAPPIVRIDLETDMKILTAERQHTSLNSFRLFLGLSERASRRELPFFQAPHQTRVMWAQHRIVYVFTHAAGDLSLYYDIELSEGAPAPEQGGLHLPTTTIITKNRIFVPVPDTLRESFALVNGERTFHVRFDTVVR